MLSTLITSKARLALLTLFLTHPGERFYQSQLIRELGLASSLVQSELKKLEAVGLLASSREANARFFQLDQSFPIYPELKSIVLKTVGLGDFLRDSLQSIGDVEVALVFGSVARNLEDVRSDVDLLVIGDIDIGALDEAVDAAERAIGREINSTVFARDEWSRRAKSEQAFAAAIISGPKIFLIGDEDELRRAA